MQRNDLVFGLLIAPLFCHVHLSAIRERERRTQPLTEAKTNRKEKKRKPLRQGTEETIN